MFNYKAHYYNFWVLVWEEQMEILRNFTQTESLFLHIKNNSC